jgi:hypothetical protein
LRIKEALGNLFRKRECERSWYVHSGDLEGYVKARDPHEACIKAIRLYCISGMRLGLVVRVASLRKDGSVETSDDRNFFLPTECVLKELGLEFTVAE